MLQLVCGFRRTRHATCMFCAPAPPRVCLSVCECVMCTLPSWPRRPSVFRGRRRRRSPTIPTACSHAVATLCPTRRVAAGATAAALARSSTPPRCVGCLCLQQLPPLFAKGADALPSLLAACGGGDPRRRGGLLAQLLLRLDLGHAPPCRASSRDALHVCRCSCLVSCLPPHR